MIRNRKKRNIFILISLRTIEQSGEKTNVTLKELFPKKFNALQVKINIWCSFNVGASYESANFPRCQIFEVLNILGAKFKGAKN